VPDDGAQDDEQPVDSSVPVDWAKWHDPYDNPASGLARRLAIVQARIRDVLAAAPHGPIRVISACAGQSRDIIGVLDGHPRRDDVVGRLVELDEPNVEYARRTAADAGITGLDLVAGDASNTDAYAGATPADLVLACGIFGNVSDEDIEHTIRCLPTLAAAGATVIWTRHRQPPDLTPTIRAWFDEHGFDEIAFDASDDAVFGIGTYRMRVAPQPFRPGVRLFTFTGRGLGV
jgi:hypothetical protein